MRADEDQEVTSESSQRRRLGQLLRRARQQRGISQSAASGLVGIPRQSLNRLEAGSRGLDVLELLQLARLYDQSVSKLLGAPHSEPSCSELELITRKLSQRDYNRLLALARSMARKNNPPA